MIWPIFYSIKFLYCKHFYTFKIYSKTCFLSFNTKNKFIKYLLIVVTQATDSKFLNKSKSFKNVVTDKKIKKLYYSCVVHSIKILYTNAIFMFFVHLVWY